MSTSISTILTLEDLVFRAQVVDDLLLLAIDPACQDEEKKLPRLQDEVQGSPEDSREIRKLAVCGVSSNFNATFRSLRARAHRISSIEEPVA